MDTGLQKIGGVRIPQCVAAYVLAYMALPEGCLEAALHAVGVMVEVPCWEGESHIFGRCPSQ
jgi:hypothetical protein